MGASKADLWRRIEKSADQAKSWADFMNSLFASKTGLLFTEISSENERTEFIKSERFKKLRDRFEDIVNLHGWVEGAKPTPSGKFLVRIPKKLHGALKQEAQEEGVSLNQLVLFKLAAQLEFAPRGHLKV